MSATTQTAFYGGPVLRSLGAGGRWGVFGVRYALYAAYGLLAFTAKPGARIIVPFLACLGAYLWRFPLEVALSGFASRLAPAAHIDMRNLPQTYYVAGGIVMLCVWVTLSKHRYRAGRVLAFIGGVLRFILKLTLFVGIIGFILYACDVQLPTLASLAAYQPTIARYASSLPSIDSVNINPSAYGVNVGPWDAALALCLIVASCVWVCLSKLLTLVLGAFPVVTRPLRPLKSLKASSNAHRPARVSLAVPSIPQRAL